MPIDFQHPLVGADVVYTASHPGAIPQRGTVTSVNVEAGIVFVRYGKNIRGTATSVGDLRMAPNGPAVTL